MDTKANRSLSQHLAGIEAGDPIALARFYHATLSQVVAKARRILCRQEDAEEIANDVYFYVWRSAASYDPCRGSVRAWLSTITQNRSIDRLRRHRNMISIDDINERAIVWITRLQSDLNLEDLIAQGESAEVAHRALLSLSPMRRQLLQLAFFQNVTHDNIAVAVGMPLGTVKSHVRRALKELRETFQLAKVHRLEAGANKRPVVRAVQSTVGSTPIVENGVGSDTPDPRWLATIRNAG